MSQWMINDLDASPTPYHAVERARERLTADGFVEAPHDQSLPGEPGRYLTARGGTLVAWIVEADHHPSFTVVGAHTDSPNLRVRRNADIHKAGWHQIGVEIYGGVLLNSWLDRDLGVAGRVELRVDGQVVECLVRDDRAVLRVPQLAIHLDREIREKGLKLDPQQHMVPIWHLPGAGAGADETDTFAAYVAELASVGKEPVLPDDIVSWDLMAFDTQGAALVGRNEEFLASARIDNLFSTFCGVQAMIDVATGDEADPSAGLPVLVLFDHEEVGSESSSGAAGSFLSHLLERISASQGRDRVAHLEALASSHVVSADGAHATHPNYIDKHDPDHHISLNGGVVVKRNANQRYASDAASEAPIREACREVGVPVQTYIHRNDLPCGSTIGPITAARLGAPTVDIGAPQFAMHSVREMAGVADIDHLRRALAAVWSRLLPHVS